MQEGRTSGEAQAGLAVTLQGGALNLHYAGQPVDLGEKWLVFYALLALSQPKSVSVEEIQDYHPWALLQPASVGRMLWRFTQQKEALHFGGRISTSPAKQSTKLFALQDSAAQRTSFWPDQSAIADHLHNLRSQRHSQALTLSEYTLLLQSGHVQQALDGLRELQKQPLSLNDSAHTEVLITTALDRLRGIYGTASQLPVLLRLYGQGGLNRANQARILVRLARHYTLSAQYPEAAAYFEKLKRLLGPDDGLEFCQYHINYGLYLRRTGDLVGAINHTLIAHEHAHTVHWWYGVQATQSNLSLMFTTLGEQHEGPARRMYFEKAKEWGQKGTTTNGITTQGEDDADIPLLLGYIHRVLGEYEQSRRCLEKAIHTAMRIPSYQDWWQSLEELANLEEALGNHEIAQVDRAQAAKIRILQKGQGERVNE